MTRIEELEEEVSQLRYERAEAGKRAMRLEKAMRQTWSALLIDNYNEAFDILDKALEEAL